MMDDAYDVSLLVQLTQDEVREHHVDAEWCLERARRNNYKHRVEAHGGKELECMASGFCAEGAVVRWLRMGGWRRDLNGFGKPDVAGYYVRSVLNAGRGGLRMLESDGPHPYIMVERVMPPDLYRLVGWLPSDAARKMRARGIGWPERRRGTVKSWIIPRPCLWSLKMIEPPD